MAIQKHGKRFDVVIVGGLGHVGLPLGIAFAEKGLKICLLDPDRKKGEMVMKGELPFIEYGAEPALKRVLGEKRIEVSDRNEMVSEGRYVIIAIGTPVDEYMNPKTRQFLEFFESIRKFLGGEQTVIIRSTVYPRTCEQIMKMANPTGLLDTTRDSSHIFGLAYCPERIVQGHAIRELGELPQIVAGMSEKAIEDASELFGMLSPKIIRTSMGEAELIKLFANAWRYIQFSVANQFYMISHNFGVDYDRVRRAMREGYERAHSLPGAGFSAGPCLLKDTMQLAAFNSNNFLLGHAAMMVNEGLPNFIVEGLRRNRDLGKTKVGILGMAFKADIDDVRDSLSFKLGKILRFHGARVFYSDEFARNPDFVSKEKLVEESEVIIVGVPHSAYKELKIPEGKEVVDLWGIVKKV